MTRLYSFSGLSCGYDGSPVIHGISGGMSKGEVTALIGPNGCGKSTLLRALAGLMDYSGELKLDGRDVRAIKRRDFALIAGIVPQQTVLSEQFSVYDVIAMGRLPRRGLLDRVNSADEKAVVEAAERTGIADLLCRGARGLSGGEKQRVFVAMVLAQNPNVYLMDEPTSALDPAQSIKIFNLMRELADSGKTVVAALHDVNMAVRFADRCILMRGGRILSDAPSAEIDGNVLERLYDVSFDNYISEKGDNAWLPLKNCL